MKVTVPVARRLGRLRLAPRQPLRRVPGIAS